MIRLLDLLKEDINLPAVPDQDLPAETPQVDRVESDVDNIRVKFAECLDIDPSEVQVKKSEKASIEDYGNMSMSGDILISCPKVKEIGAEKVADLLNRFGFLEDIEINGESGRDLSALVFADSRQNGGGGNPIGLMFGYCGVGDMAGGDVIITSKATEFRLVPFMQRMGVNTANCEDAMEQYWNAIGGRAISDTEIMRYYQELAASLRPRLGMRSMGQLGGRRAALPGRQPRMVPRRRGDFNRNDRYFDDTLDENLTQEKKHCVWKVRTTIKSLYQELQRKSFECEDLIALDKDLEEYLETGKYRNRDCSDAEAANDIKSRVKNVAEKAKASVNPELYKIASNHLLELDYDIKELYYR